MTIQSARESESRRAEARLRQAFADQVAAESAGLNRSLSAWGEEWHAAERAQWKLAAGIILAWLGAIAIGLGAWFGIAKAVGAL